MSLAHSHMSMFLGNLGLDPERHRFLLSDLGLIHPNGSLTVLGFQLFDNRTSSVWMKVQQWKDTGDQAYLLDLHLVQYAGAPLNYLVVDRSELIISESNRRLLLKKLKEPMPQPWAQIIFLMGVPCHPDIQSLETILTRHTPKQGASYVVIPSSSIPDSPVNRPEERCPFAVEGRFSISIPRALPPSQRDTHA